MRAEGYEDEKSGNEARFLSAKSEQFLGAWTKLPPNCLPLCTAIYNAERLL